MKRSATTSTSSDSQHLITRKKITLDHNGQKDFGLMVSASDTYKQDVDLLVRFDVSSPANEMVSKSVVIPYFAYDTYFGIRDLQYFVPVNESQLLEIIAVNPKGSRIQADAKLVVKYIDWNCVWENWGYRGSYQCTKKEEEVFNQAVHTQTDQDVKFSFLVS